MSDDDRFGRALGTVATALGWFGLVLAGGYGILMLANALAGSSAYAPWAVALSGVASIGGAGLWLHGRRRRPAVWRIAGIVVLFLSGSVLNSLVFVPWAAALILTLVSLADARLVEPAG